MIVCRFSARTLVIVVAFLLMVLLGACENVRQLATPTPTVTVTPPATVEFRPTRTPTPYPPGSPENPLVLGLVVERPDAALINAADTLVKKLIEFSGYTVAWQIFPDYSELLGAMGRRDVQIAFLPPLTYLWANQEGYADVGLLTNHFGVYQYGLQFIANRNSNFTPFFDVDRNQSTADPAQALLQFSGKRPCFVEPTSISGYIFPVGLLLQNRISFLDPVITQSHTAVVRALYIRDICDFGVTFAISGDPRTSSSLADLPDVLRQILVIWRSDPIIPNTNLSYVPDLRRDVRQNMTTVFQDLMRTEEGRQLLSLVTNYDIQDLKPVTDAVYDPLRLAVEAASMDLQTLIGK